MRLLHQFETVINTSLLVMMAISVALTTIGLGWSIIQDVMAPPILRLGVTELIDLFSLFLLVLIGVELLETVKAYMVDRSVHVEVIVSVGLVAITRKVVLLEPKTLDGLSLIGIAAIIAALAGAHWALRRTAALRPA
jgi:uncharacterized membrane protein (DUF373 family)